MTEPQALHDPTDLPAVAAKLITTIEGLTESIQDLLERNVRSEEEIANSKKQTRWQWVAIAAIAVLLPVVVITMYQQIQTSRQQIQTSQTLASVQGDVLCPVWAVFLGGYNPSTRAAGPDRATYEATYAVIRDGYARLGCTNPFVPPPTTRPSPPR